MESRNGGGRVRALLNRVFLGDRDYHDPTWDRAADSALTRAQEREERLRHLEQRVEVIRKK